MFSSVRSFLPLSLPRTAATIAALTLALGACDSDPKDPGTTQDVTVPDGTEETTTAETSEGDVAAEVEQDTAAETAPETSPETTAETTPETSSETTAETTAETTEDTTEDTSPDTTEDTTADTTPSDAIVLPTERPPITTTSSTFVGDWQMTTGQEATKCVVKRLDNPDVLWVSQIRTQLAKGSHHLIIYKSEETVERTTPFNCDPFVETLKGNTFPLMITQIREETLAFPNGVAFKFEPNQMVRLEAHYNNYFPDTTITAHGDVHFDGIAAEDVVAEANMLFYGNPDFEIPPGKYSTPWRYLSVLPNTHVFAVTGHTHAYGTNVEIAMSTNVDDEGMSLYPMEDAPFVWDEPPVETFDPALTFDGNQGFRYRCSWDNTTNNDLGFGESANQEMCFLWAYYYPSQGYRICVSPGGIGGGVAGDEVCCPGHFICDYIQQFL